MWGKIVDSNSLEQSVGLVQSDHSSALNHLSALRLLIAVAYSVIAPAAASQAVGNLEDPEGLVVEEVFVTGSLLPKGDFVSNAPVSTISATQFEMSNTTNVEALVNSMPQVVGGADRSSTFGQGIATANLRGLGENRTLVLINSRRFVPTFPDGGTVDLNFIPVGLIDRVEVLTGGASAAYGSDALAGVINFILKEETDGWEVNAGAEATQERDSDIYNFNITNGGKFNSGRGKYLIHADVLERKPLYYTERELTRGNLVDSVDENGNPTLITASNGYPVNPRANFWYPYTDDWWYGAQYMIDNAGNLEAYPWATGEGFASLGAGAEGDDPFENTQGFKYLQRPQERYSLKAKISHEFGGIEPYADVYYSKSKVPQVWNGSFLGYPNSLGYVSTVENNPYWSDEAKAFISEMARLYEWYEPGEAGYVDANQNGIADTLRFPWMTRTFKENGQWNNNREYESFQVEMGVKGDLSSSWGYEAFLQIGEVESILDPYPLLNPDRIQQGLLITADGKCIDPSNGCVPVNIWSDDIGPEATAFITYPRGAGKSVSVNKQNVFMATVSGNTGDLFSLPGDPGPIGLVIGVEYREIKSDIKTPKFIEDGYYEGGGWMFPPFSMNADVDFKNIIAEAAIPLIAGKPGIDFLELELGLRISEHSITGRDNTAKVALSYYPIPDLQLRGSFNKATRSPSINELFSYAEGIAYGLADPCTNGGYYNWGADPLPESQQLAETCISTGVPEQNLYDYQYTVYQSPREIGGNLELSPEDAETFSIGLVFTPFAIEDDLSISLDYFRVEIEDYIERTPVTTPELMASCFDLSLGRGGPGSAACEAINRDADGRITSLFMGYQNLGRHKVEGLDVNLQYGTDLFTGYLSLDYFATKLFERSISDNTYGDVDYNCLGIFNGPCDNIIDYPVFDFKHRMTVGWSKGNWDLQLVWKHVSSLDDGDDSVDYFREKLDAYSLVDFSGRYQLTDSISATAGIKNIFDEEPQPIGSNSWENSTENNTIYSNTYAQYYDVFGRTMFLKVTAVF